MAYLQKGVNYKYLKKIMSLPFLPVEEIPAEWERLKAQATTPALLTKAYRQREGAHRLMRNFMSLHMLPYEHIRSTFDALCQEVDNANNPRLDYLTSYMRSYWMESTVWEV
ncbi:Hypp9677 [Branchiostoma lanceolatum]|uniref:Hypp9677 protein n=1 Tax=Branchiostoma lanceolatum TaxID=7740 RepID=A0A8S4MNM4_BRALA|nr:Hypp9677 [Branchiostoma lanceolatum]